MNRRAMLGASVLVALLGSAASALRVRARRFPRVVHLLVHAAHPGRVPVPHVDPPPEHPPAAVAPSMFRLDATHTGRSGYVLPTHPISHVRVAATARISTQPVLANDGLLVFGAHDGFVYAARPETGRIAWRFATGDRIYSSPVVTPIGDVYLGSDADRFFRLSAGGALEGGLATDDDADTSPALAADGSLRFAAGRTLYSVDPDLTVRWRLEFGGKLFSSPAVQPDGTAIVGCQDNSVYAIDANGAVRWRFVSGNDVDATPAISDGVVYIGSDDGTFYALDAATGALRWQSALGGFVRAGAALGLDGTVVVGTYGPRARVVGLRRSDGVQRWEIVIPGPPTAEFGVASSPLVDRTGRYAVGTPDDSVLLIGRDGHLDARVPMPADVDSSPVLLSDGVLAVGCDDGGLYLLTDPP